MYLPQPFLYVLWVLCGEILFEPPLERAGRPSRGESSGSGPGLAGAQAALGGGASFAKGNGRFRFFLRCFCLVCAVANGLAVRERGFCRNVP